MINNISNEEKKQEAPQSVNHKNLREVANETLILAKTKSSQSNVNKTDIETNQKKKYIQQINSRLSGNPIPKTKVEDVEIQSPASKVDRSQSNVSGVSEYITRVIEGACTEDEKLIIVRKRENDWDNRKWFIN